jgi:excisionase family DNA binding protein
MADKNNKDQRLEEANKIRGIQALADLLGCSIPTAHKLKASGKIPYYQEGRLLLFDRNEVLNALKKGK